MKNHQMFPPWSISKWDAVDDRVRGGSSQSHLEEIKIKTEDFGEVSVEKERSGSGARFWGTLDTKTLGGAGFASQRFAFGPTPLSLPRFKYRGLCIHASLDHKAIATTSSPKVFTIVLNTSTIPYPDPKPTPGPRPSVLTYEANFTPKHGKGLEKICIPWQNFEATYRGRKIPTDDPKWKALETDTIYQFSIMCRSAFGKQEGDFSVIVGGISGWKSEEGRARDSCWTSLQGWNSGLWGSQEGKVRLSDDEKL